MLTFPPSLEVQACDLGSGKQIHLKPAFEWEARLKKSRTEGLHSGEDRCCHVQVLEVVSSVQKY